MFDIYSIDSRVIISFAVIAAILVVAEIFLLCIRSQKGTPRFKELKDRIRTWWVIAAIVAISVLLGKGMSVAFWGLVSFLALKEYLSLIPTRRADRRVLFWVYLSIPVQYYWVYSGWYGMFIIFIPVYMFLLMPLRMLLIGETKEFLSALSKLHWGLMTTVFCLSHAAYLLVLSPQYGEDYTGTTLLLFLIILTQLNDVLQYVWGKLLGKKKIVPKVSPGKTYGGFIGGVTSTTIIAYFLAPVMIAMDGWHAIGAGLIIGVGGFVGDIIISAFKRDLGIKDSGAILPGHGGILDRIDSLTYTSPLFFHYFFYFAYPSLFN